MAKIVGVSTRTVRHYHHEGLLPEPARDSSGYRRYGISDLAQLLRIRRLRELGCSVDDVRNILVHEPSQGLRDVLRKLDEDLRAQQRSLTEMRERIQQVLTEPELDTLDPDSSHYRDVFSKLKDLGAEGPGYRADMALISAIPQQDAQDWNQAWAHLLSDPADAQALASSYAEFDALISVGPDDPRVQALAEQLWNLMPDEFLSSLSNKAETAVDSSVVKALAESMSPAQGKVMELLTQRLSAAASPDTKGPKR